VGETARKWTADDSVDLLAAAVPVAAPGSALPPEYEVDNPRGWARVGTSCEKRLLRVDKEGLLLPSDAGAVEGSFRAEPNQGFGATTVDDGGGSEDAGGGAEAAALWVAWEVWEVCSRDRMWVWV
jgi:hypothetical protein